MRLISLRIFLIWLFPAMVFCQNNILKNIQEDFESFKYADVITLTGQALTNIKNISPDELLKIYTLQGASYFSLSNNDSARIAFVNILQIDSTFTLDSTQISPKIISFFNQTKRNYLLTKRVNKPPVKTKIDSLSLQKIKNLEQQNSNFKGALVRSIFLPGWGQLYLGNSAKGILLTGAGLLALGSSVYFIFDTKNKENKYLNETNPGFINGKYNDYNTSYKIRNTFLISYVIIWLYSQIDLLLFQNNPGSIQSIPLTNSLNLNINPIIKTFSLNLNF